MSFQAISRRCGLCKRTTSYKPVIKAGYGDEYTIGVKTHNGPFAFDEWKADPDATMFVSGHGIDDEWYHAVCHIDDAYANRGLYALYYTGPEDTLFMVAELYIDEDARDVHITSAVIDHNNTENRPLAHLESMLYKHTTGPWILHNYLSSFFGPSWQVTIDRCNIYTPGIFSDWKNKKIGRSTLEKCRDLFASPPPATNNSPAHNNEWGHVYIICNL